MRGRKSTRLRAAAIVASLGAAGAAVMAPAFACSGISSLLVSPALVAAGSEIQVVAEGLPAEPGQEAKQVELWWVGEGGKDKQLLTTAQPSAEGRLDTKVRAPAGAAEGPYLVRLREVGSTEDRSANALVKVVDSGLPAPSPARSEASATRPLSVPGGFDEVAESGTSPALVPVGLLGLALVGAGGVALARQARREED